LIIISGVMSDIRINGMFSHNLGMENSLV